MNASHRPKTQAHPPPQSTVPGAQYAVHSISEQSGSKRAFTQSVAWQHVAGTQSESTVHISISSSDTSDGKDTHPKDTITTARTAKTILSITLLGMKDIKKAYISGTYPVLPYLKPDKDPYKEDTEKHKDKRKQRDT